MYLYGCVMEGHARGGEGVYEGGVRGGDFLEVFYVRVMVVFTRPERLLATRTR